MVVLHVKSTTSFSPSPSPEEETEFLHECAATGAIADVAAALAGTAGLQARLLSLCRRLRERCADAGAAGGELERALSEAEAYASKVQVQHNKFLSPRALREHIKNIEKTTASLLQGSSEALCPHHPKSDEKLDGIQLWWAGKELAMDKKLSDYIGTNDKTKSSTCIGIAAIMEPPSCEILGVTYGRCLPACLDAVLGVSYAAGSKSGIRKCYSWETRQENQFWIEKPRVVHHGHCCNHGASCCERDIWPVACLPGRSYWRVCSWRKPGAGQGSVVLGRLSLEINLCTLPLIDPVRNEQVWS